jgi:hypothetical protein
VFSGIIRRPAPQQQQRPQRSFGNRNGNSGGSGNNGSQRRFSNEKPRSFNNRAN